MADGYLITPGDLQKINQLLTKDGRRRYGDPPGFGGPTPDDEEDSGAELYVARTPFAGIPALGFGTLTGTGTAGSVDDQPGHAECYLWRVLRPSAGVFQMDPIDAYPKDVLNLSTSAVAGDTWLLVARDKFGEWFAVVGGGGGSVDVCGTPENATTGTGTDAGGDECQSCVEDPHLIVAPELIRFSCDFITEEQAGGQCGEGGETGTGTDAAGRKTALVRTRGKTEHVTFQVNPIWCASICDIKTQTLTLCFENGRFTGHVFGDPPVCP